MRRLMPIAAFAVILALPLWAQHGGGHAAGGHASFSGGHGGGFSGSHIGGGQVSRGMHFAPGATRGPTFSQRSFSNRPFLHDGFRGSRIRPRGFRNNCFGFACRGFGYPWAYGEYYDPYWWWDSGSSYDEDYERDRATANEMNEQSLEEQQMLRQEQADGDRDRY